ncbi:TasA family protein [Methanococcoides sp.]|uniref:TasA family protein n=1 Tax=Methanococcoides sp. TaxID=1966350 RepID=UPI00272ED6A5|nr:TasA family protein [Methanococcoides sp.]
MVNKSIFLSLLLIGVVAASAGAGTWATFSDTETSAGNTFTAGTLDIGISNSFAFGPVAPGDANTETITITNSGNIAANSVFLKLDVLDSEPSADTEPETVAEDGTDKYDISEMIEITSIKYGATDISGLYSDLNLNSYLDLDDLNAADDVEINGASPLGTTSVDVTIDMTFVANAGNEYQGDLSTVDVIVRVEQN